MPLSARTEASRKIVKSRKLASILFIKGYDIPAPGIMFHDIAHAYNYTDRKKKRKDIALSSLTAPNGHRSRLNVTLHNLSVFLFRMEKMCDQTNITVQKED
jgi:hypothetical protein